ncbi:MAG TPA: MurR/RpiR family transcriptional regulator [Alphaproteobacteria bacterium]|nr:MurR/RpiR family transcriptional regulator [Alphaproteobacteria bacterium]
MRSGAAIRHPTDMLELKEMIAKKHVVFPSELERVMRAALDRPDIIAFGTSRSIADLCGVSPSTVVRLSGHLGFSNFKALRELFRAYLAKTRAHGPRTD